MNKKKEGVSLFIGFLGASVGLCGVVAFNRFVLGELSLTLRMVSMILNYWVIALIPTIVMVVNKDKLTDYGFGKHKIISQVVTGVVIGFAMSVVLTFVPHLLGLGAFVDNGARYQYWWQFTYEFIYCIVAIGFAEEFIFRGFVYEKIKRISQKEVIAVIGSSVLFGVFHLFSGNIIQMVMTAFIGAFFCICRMKIKNCSTLSLIIAHGIHDALITVGASILIGK